MKSDLGPGEEHELFTQWAVSQGIIVNGVGPARFPGRGLGMVALRKIQENEAIIRVPRPVMLTVEAIPSSFTSRFPERTPVHTLLSAFLCNGAPEDIEPYEIWKKTWPSRKDFEECMPILWPEELRSKSASLLPPSISGCWSSVPKEKVEYEYESSHQNILAQQERRLDNAWDSVLAVFPDTEWEAFSYHWLIVNTRCFFYLVPGREPPEDRNDAMALLPFADYFNHSNVTCNVKFDGQEYVFRAVKAYGMHLGEPAGRFTELIVSLHVEAGEEIFISYGPHPNDFLFTEYGFYLDANESDTLYLDDIILQDISPFLQKELSLQQYYGNYQLTATGVCYRTEIVACIKSMPLEDWQNHTLGYSTREMDAKKSEDVIRGWIRTYVGEAAVVLEQLEDLGSSTSKVARDHQGKVQVQLLLTRWRQIQELCLLALEAVKC